MLVVVVADWCEPCQRLKPILESMQDDGYDIRIVDLEKSRKHPWVIKHRIAQRPLPCLVLCTDAEGKHVKQIHSGYRSRKWIEKWMKK